MLSLPATRAFLLPTLLSTLPAIAAGGVRTSWMRPPPDARQEAGQQTGQGLAAELGCGGCHAGVPGPETVRSRAPAFGPAAAPLGADFVFTYLADPVRRRDDIGASRMPDFRLDEGERVALALFLARDGTAGGDGGFAAARARHADADAALGGRIFAALGCAGCHAGIPDAPILEGPDLSREGVRVRPVWLHAFLAHPTAVRGDGHPTLGAARMPDFRLTAAEADALATWLQARGSRFATLDTAPLTAFEMGRTKRLVEDRLACLGCHRIGGQGGRIGPSLEGVAERLDPSFVLEMILAPQRASPGSPMPHQPIQPREAARVARYLVGLDGTRTPPERKSLTDATNPAWATATVQAPGADLYARHCVACHGPAGRADGWNAPNLPVPPAAHADSARMSARVDDALYDGIYSGAWVLDGSPRMPAFGDLLSPAEIKTLVGYIRTLCGCSAPAWSRDGKGGAG